MYLIKWQIKYKWYIFFLKLTKGIFKIKSRGGNPKQSMTFFYYIYFKASIQLKTIIKEINIFLFCTFLFFFSLIEKLIWTKSTFWSLSLPFSICLKFLLAHTHKKEVTATYSTGSEFSYLAPFAFGIHDRYLSIRPFLSLRIGFPQCKFVLGGGRDWLKLEA